MTDTNEILQARLSAAPDAGESAALARLQAVLARRAAEEDLLDVAYRELDTPLGRLLLASTPAGLVRVAFPLEDAEAVLASLAAQVSPRVLRAPARLDAVARELDEYFDGRRHAFDVPVDLQLARGFRRAVLEKLVDVPYARTVSYAELAARTGSPKAVRAVGTACALNPVPLVVPCHRVVRSDGTPGSYRGGAEAKRRLLALEAAA
jgi:methylated-DNA-[protein]-cysteine S-methyltransferase